MEGIDYLNFDLRFLRLGQTVRTQVSTSPAGEASGDFASPFQGLSRPEWLARGAQELGAALFGAVFEGQVETALRRSLDKAREKDKGLRIRLHLVDVPDLAELPWEVLYDPVLDQFMGLSLDTPIVRYLGLPEPIEALAVKPPLRVLVVISSPINRPELDVDREWSKLVQGLGGEEEGDLVVLERLEEATLGALQKRLRRGEYHVFHFIGHGGFDAAAQDGVLALEDEKGMQRLVRGQALGTLLHDERTLRLAMLNACEGARASASDPFAGTAQSLVRRQIPAVIAMQFEISDKAAMILAGEFYTALADGYPVDAALTEARKAIYLQGDEKAWGTPVLYMRSPDGRIFDLQDEAERDRQRQPPPVARVETMPVPAAQPAHTQRARPAMGGDSIGHQALKSAATLGFLAVDRAEPDRVYIVSDFSGIYSPDRPDIVPTAGDLILQPGGADGGDAKTDAIAQVSRWTKWTTISQVLRLEDVSPQIRGRGYLQGIRSAAPGMLVFSVGRTGGLVAGRVLHVGAHIECTPMLQAGDSGAILLDAENYAVGLGFATDPSRGTSLFLPMQGMLDAMNVDLVTEGVWRSLLG